MLGQVQSGLERTLPSEPILKVFEFKGQGVEPRKQQPKIGRRGGI